MIEQLTDIFKIATGNSTVDLSQVGEDARLSTDLGLDSVGILYVVIAVEEAFGIRFDDVGAGDFQTLCDVIDYIEKKVNA